MKLPIEKLTEALFRKHPVWEFCNDDASGESVARPVKKLPISSAGGRVIGCELRLADGSQIFGFLGNFSLTKKDQNQHFLTLSVLVNGSVEHLARYHDFDFAKHGPAWLAQKLGKRIEDVFPISYDLSDVVTASTECLRGFIPLEPEKKLSRREIIQLAISR